MKKTGRLQRQDLRWRLQTDMPYYVMLIIPMAFFIIFKYWPMFGLSIAFQNYKAGAPFLGDSVKWVGLRWFKQFFSYPFAWRLITNTLILSVYNLAVTFPLAIFLALILNEIRNRKVKQFTTTLSFLPYFISTTVVVGMMTNFLNINDGIINQMIVSMGGTAKDFMGASQYFRTLYVLSGCWQNLGFDAIVFTAAIAGIDQEQYESARLDGAGRLQQIIYITIPNILPTIMIMLILRIGKMMSVGSEKILLLYNPMTYDTAYVISTFVYRKGILEASYSFSAAVGLFNSVINFVLLVSVNFLSRRLTESSLW